MAKAKPIVISYLRYSTPEQRLGDSERRQLAKAEHWAEVRGLVIDQTLRDLGVSAYKGANRIEGVLASLLQAIKANRIPKGSTILVESLDRFSRERINKALELFLSIINSGIRIVTLGDDQEYTSDNIDLYKLLYSLMIMSRANDESHQKSIRVKAAADQKKKRARAGVPQQQRTPRWIVVEDGKFKIVKHEADRIRDMMKSISRGTPLKQVAEEMGESASNVWFWARSKTLIGEYQPKTVIDHKNGYETAIPDGEPIKDYYPAIVTENLFYQVQKLLGSKSRGSQIGKSRWVNPFVGKLHNSNGENYIVVVNGKTRAYVLPSAKAGKGECIYIPTLMFETAFGISLQQHGWYLSQAEQSSNDDDADKLRVRLRELDDETRAMQDGISSGKLKMVAAMPLANRISDEREKVQRALDHLMAQRASFDAVGEMHAKVIATFDAMLTGNGQTKEDRFWLRSAIAMTISDITLDAVRFGWRLAGVRSKVTMANGVTLPWRWVFDTNKSEIWLPVSYLLGRDDLPDVAEDGVLKIAMSGETTMGLYRDNVPTKIEDALGTLTEGL